MSLKFMRISRLILMPGILIFLRTEDGKSKPGKSAGAVGAGELKAAVRFGIRYHKSIISQDMVVYKDSRRIDFITRVDWQETHRLLKTAFYTDIRSTRAAYDIQFGRCGTSHPLEYKLGLGQDSRFADTNGRICPETGYGVSLLNDCKYVYSIKDNVIKLSLLKSAVYPDTEADKGVQEFTYSLYILIRAA